MSVRSSITPASWPAWRGKAASSAAPYPQGSCSGAPMMRRSRTAQWFPFGDLDGCPLTASGRSAGGCAQRSARGAELWRVIHDLTGADRSLIDRAAAAHPSTALFCGRGRRCRTPRPYRKSACPSLVRGSSALTVERAVAYESAPSKWRGRVMKVCGKVSSGSMLPRCGDCRSGSRR